MFGYILNDKNEPVAAENKEVWLAWMHKNDDRRQVSCEMVGDYFVSTIFKGYNQEFRAGYPETMWETKVFNAVMVEVSEMPKDVDPKDAEVKRMHCSGSLEQAEAMHRNTVKELQSRLNLIKGV